jgi:hypothetical protein
MSKKKFNSAKIIGDGLAIFQHSFDKLVEFGFKEIRKQSVKKPKSKDQSKIVKCLKKIGGFFGIMGEEYYRKYEDLKKNDK